LRPRTELGDERAVALDVGALEIAQQTPALADEHEQPAAGVMVLLVRTQVLGELVDPAREQRDLHLGRPGVALGTAVLADQLLLLFRRQTHSSRSHRLRGLTRKHAEARG
jgi:hypothetical protein